MPVSHRHLVQGMLAGATLPATAGALAQTRPALTGAEGQRTGTTPTTLRHPGLVPGSTERPIE